MTANRVLFMIVMSILALLVVAMVVLSAGSPDLTDMLVGLVRLLVGVGVLLFSIRLLRGIAGRR